MNGFPSPTLLTCLVYTGWLLGAICIFFTYKIIGKTAEYRERMGKLHKFPEKAPRKIRRNTSLQASQVSGRSDKLPKDNKLHVESISNSDATKLHTEVNEYINQKLTILNISITVFGVVMGWVITGLSSIQNSLQGASNCNVPPVSLQPVTLLLPTVLLFFLCIMLWYIEAISKQMHILSTYLEVFHLSDWESHYQDLLKSTRLNTQGHLEKTPVPRTAAKCGPVAAVSFAKLYRCTLLFSKCPQSKHKNSRRNWRLQTYSIQSDMPYVILSALTFLTIAITFAICFLYRDPGIAKTLSPLIIIFAITSLISILIFINLWLNRDLDDFRLEATRSWEDILFCRTLTSDKL